MATAREASNSKLSLFIDRVENLEGEKKGIADDIRDVYAEAKAVGFDVKGMREIVRLRKMQPEDLKARNEILNRYAEELGMDLL